MRRRWIDGTGLQIDSNHHKSSFACRYYYLSFGEQVKTSHCVDIGVRIRGRPIDSEWAQLGAISVHEGEVRRLKIQVPAVSKVYSLSTSVLVWIVKVVVSPVPRTLNCVQSSALSRKVCPRAWNVCVV